MAFYLAFIFKHEKLEEKKSQNIFFFFCDYLLKG